MHLGMAVAMRARLGVCEGYGEGCGDDEGQDQPYRAFHGVFNGFARLPLHDNLRFGRCGATLPLPGTIRTMVRQRPQSLNGSVIRIVSSRWGLVLSRATGQLTSSSTRRTYLMQVAGSSAKERAPLVLSLQPSNSSQIGRSLACAPMGKGKRPT